MPPKKTKQKNWRKIIEDHNPEALFFDEKYWDAAIIGIGNAHGSHAVPIYSYSELIRAHAEELIKQEKMPPSEAWESATEWVDFNVVDAYVGPDTPIVAYVTAEDPDE